MKNNKYFYIYNLKKTNFLLDHDIKLVEVGTGKTDKVFFKFLKTDSSKEIIDNFKEINGFDD